MLLMLDDLILVDEIVGLLVNEVLVCLFLALLDDGVVVNLFSEVFNLLLY